MRARRKNDVYNSIFFNIFNTHGKKIKEMAECEKMEAVVYYIQTAT